jgi:putative heme-binding domain-containing protein
MEWDEGLPWYRAVRVCHSTPGSDFVWRTGAANTPNYYLDSLPPTYETGRGSPVGLEFYDHYAFPAKYRGAYFMADWSVGIIYAVHLERQGASYKATAEKFCTGSPLNVTDVVVGPDGALYFTMGGRGGHGGIFRIVADKPGNPSAKEKRPLEEVLTSPQPLSAWGRARAKELLDKEAKGTSLERVLQGVAWQAQHPEMWSTTEIIRASNLVQDHGADFQKKNVIEALLASKTAELRAHGVWMLGLTTADSASKQVLGALKDDDAFVRRRACEALVRLEVEPPVEALWPLLADRDIFLRTAARPVLQRIAPEKWVNRLWRQKSSQVVYEGIVALCKTNQAAPHTTSIFEFLHQGHPESTDDLLAWVRVVQLALFHTKDRPDSVSGIGLDCLELFPHKDARVSRELAIVLTDLRRHRHLTEPVHVKLLDALLASKDDPAQQIHYFYCLRLLHDGWTAEQKDRLLAWYDGSREWKGGFSFTPFLENVLRDLNPVFTSEDRLRLLSHAEEYPSATAVLLRLGAPPEVAKQAVAAYERVASSKHRRIGELKGFLIETMGQLGTPEAQSLLRRIADSDPAQHEAAVRALARTPTAENYPYLVKGLASGNKLVVVEVLEALRKSGAKPKPEEALPFRNAILAASKLEPKQRWQVIELLRQWTGGKQFGADAGDWKTELGAWAKWFGQTFPKEPALPDVAGDQPVESKYRYADLLSFVEGEGRTGDIVRGKAAFEKGQCFKCHKYGKEGEGIGPDLTTVSKRFKRADVLESIYYPSKVISDQYRSTTIVTKKGVQITGLAAPQGDLITVLQSDGTKVTLKKSEIDTQYASLVSVMPEKLLDALTKQEIADLFAFLESEAK